MERKKHIPIVKGYEEFTESLEMTKEEADFNTEVVDVRIGDLERLLQRSLPISNDEIEEKECLQAIRALENNANATVQLEDSTETINYLPYSNQQLGISFEYPSNWNVEEKTNRFSDAPADVEVHDGLNSFKYQLDRTDVGESDFIDLELMADMAQNSLTRTTETSLVEGVDMDKYRIDGKDTATFLIKTERSFGENSYFNSDYATQVFVIDNGNRFDLIMYQNTVTDFDTPQSQEILNHMLNSFQFINSEEKVDTTDENDEDQKGN